MFNLKTIIITVASIALVGLGINAFAHGGMGWSGGWSHHGQGWHHQSGYGPGYNDQLTKEEYKQFDQKRETFMKETQELRSNLFEKERELQNELAKDEPDASKASRLQKEISELQAQIDQKRIDHMIETRKLNPNTGRGYMRGGPILGYGSGSYGSGYCWQ
jgi:Spy/CpxP family protein refolding chaperone